MDIRVFVCAAAATVWAHPAAAQQPASVGSSTQIEVGYSGLREGSGEDARWDKGIQADIAQPVGGPSAARFSLVGDFSWHHNDFYDDTLTSYLGGLRTTFAGGRAVEPFAQVLAGVELCCSNHGWVVQPGGGVNIWIAPRLAVRAQVDFRLARYTRDGIATTYKETRTAVGVVVPFGRR